MTREEAERIVHVALAKALSLAETGSVFEHAAERKCLAAALLAAVAAERERCARRVEQFFASCFGPLERRYSRALAATIREEEPADG